jgi:hypothetical protein
VASVEVANRATEVSIDHMFGDRELYSSSESSSSTFDLMYIDQGSPLLILVILPEMFSIQLVNNQNTPCE